MGKGLLCISKICYEDHNLVPVLDHQVFLTALPWDVQCRSSRTCTITLYSRIWHILLATLHRQDNEAPVVITWGPVPSYQHVLEMSGIHRDQIASTPREQPQFMEPASTVTCGMWKEWQLKHAVEESMNKACRLHGNSRSAPYTTEYPQPDHLGGDWLRLAQQGALSIVWQKGRGSLPDMDGLLHGHAECLSYNVPQNNNYIYQFHRPVHTRLGRRITMELFFLKKKKKRWIKSRKQASAFFTTEQCK